MAAPFAEIELRGSVVIVRTGGDLDVRSADRFEETALEAVPNRAQGMVIDLGRSRYVDSSGIRVLFSLARRLKARRQRVALAVPGEAPLRRILELVNVQSMLSVSESVEEAITDIQADQAGGAVGTRSPAG